MADWEGEEQQKKGGIEVQSGPAEHNHNEHEGRTETGKLMEWGKHRGTAISVTSLVFYIYFCTNQLLLVMLNRVIGAVLQYETNPYLNSGRGKCLWKIVMH